jgi:O-antigen/teichoic acid export membrane protein
MYKPKSLFTNAIWNIITVGVTGIAGFILVPVLINDIGAENFGIYTIILMIGGFAALQNLGLGEATLKYVSQYYAIKDIGGINRVLGATLLVNFFSGVIVSGLIIVFSPLVISWFKLSVDNVESATIALRISGFAFLILIPSRILPSRGNLRLSLSPLIVVNCDGSKLMVHSPVGCVG